MPPRQQQPDGAFPIGMRDLFDWLYFIANIAAMFVEPIIRHRMGKRGVGKIGACSLLLILCYAESARSYELRVYAYVWVVCVVYRRITADSSQHTEFHGTPLLTEWCISSERLARAAEAALVYVAGVYLQGWHEPVGQVVTAASFGLAVKFWIESAVIERQKEAAHNATVHMEIMQQRMQQVRRN